jgi:glutamine amidotransferase
MKLFSGLSQIPTLTQPVLGICLGMQLMCNKDSKKIPEFRVFDVDVLKFSNKVKVQMGLEYNIQLEIRFV